MYLRFSRGGDTMSESVTCGVVAKTKIWLTKLVQAVHHPLEKTAIDQLNGAR